MDRDIIMGEIGLESWRRIRERLVREAVDEFRKEGGGGMFPYIHTEEGSGEDRGVHIK